MNNRKKEDLIRLTVRKLISTFGKDISYNTSLFSVETTKTASKTDRSDEYKVNFSGVESKEGIHEGTCSITLERFTEGGTRIIKVTLD